MQDKWGRVYSTININNDLMVIIAAFAAELHDTTLYTTFAHAMEDKQDGV